jgi:deferrochelatase/peroxidase EfeB
MSRRKGHAPGLTRRRLVRSVTGLAATGAALDVGLARAEDERSAPLSTIDNNQYEPFWGAHQGGITTPAQRHTYAAAFDLATNERDDIVAMLRAWTSAAARMSRGDLAAPVAANAALPAADSGEALDLSPARLTITFGFGAGLFVKDGVDRYRLLSQRPPALVDLPNFNGDELIETRTGGDLSVQACADDPQVAFHAVRQLARLAYRVATVRWTQAGFTSTTSAQQTPRNLMGFKDGTRNLAGHDPAALAQFVWVGDEGPEWMRGGSYVVLRRIRIALEHWDRMPLEFQEQAIGRHKNSGAPIGGTNEFDLPDFTSVDPDGDPVIPESAHIRIAAAESNDGARILRRPYSYNDGTSFIIERWPPWRQGAEYDAGLFFVCYQRDPRTGFIKIFDRLAKFDMLNQFVTHTGGGLFACPGGVAEGEFIGQRLFEGWPARFPSR